MGVKHRTNQPPLQETTSLNSGEEMGPNKGKQGMPAIFQEKGRRILKAFQGLPRPWPSLQQKP